MQGWFQPGDIVFDILDELVDVFQSEKIHVGMDEVFILGDESCPRCSGKDKAELFAGEVTRLHDHLAERGVEMWMWGDRLIDAETSGLNKWRASMNGTHKAIDMIPKDVVICDWQYPSAEGTAYYFALKGFRVISCPHQRPHVGIALANMQRMFRDNSVPAIQQRFLGVMQTSWASADSFIHAYHTDSDNETQEGAVECFTEIMKIAAGFAQTPGKGGD